MSHDKALLKAAGAAAPVNFAGVWQNELRSTVDFTVQGAEVSGTYTSAVSSGGVPIAGSVRGYVNGDLIAFTVNWPSAAITAWVGQLTMIDGAGVIKTLWQMTTNVADADEEGGLWASIYAGADEFTRP